MKGDLRNTYIDAMETGIFDAELANEYIKIAKEQGYETTSDIEGWLGVEPIIGIANWTLTSWRIGQTGYNSTYIKEMKKLTLADLKPTESEWNGEGLPTAGVKCEYEYHRGGVCCGVCEILFINDAVVFFKPENAGYAHRKIDQVNFRPIETPERKAAKEREEAAIEIHNIANEAFFSEKTMGMPDDAGWEFADEDVRRMWYAVVDLTGYRKASGDRN